MTLSPQTSTAIDQVITYLRHSREFRDELVYHKVIPEAPPQWVPSGQTLLSPILQKVLPALGVTSLYTHQAAALEKIDRKTHTAIVTPTASGKTLTYNIPVVEAILQDPLARALYLFPLKALEQDQLKKLRELNEALG